MGVTKNIAVILGSLGDSYQSTIWQGIVDYCSEHNINIMTFTFSPLIFAHSEESGEIFDFVRHFIDLPSFDGIIYFSGVLARFTEPDFMKSFLSQIKMYPSVSLNLEAEGSVSVLLENYSGMHKLVTHLIKEHGYKRFGFIHGPEGHQEAEERFSAFTDALKENGLPLLEEFYRPGNFSEESGEEYAEFLLESGVENLDVLVGCDDVCVLGFIEEITGQGIKIPEDLAVVGFDDDIQASLIYPPLTTVRQPLHKQGYCAAEALNNQFNNKQQSRSIILPTELVLRKTCGCFFPKEEKRKDEDWSEPLKALEAAFFDAAGKRDFSSFYRYLEANLYIGNLQAESPPKIHRLICKIRDSFMISSENGYDKEYLRITAAAVGNARNFVSEWVLNNMNMVNLQTSELTQTLISACQTLVSCEKYPDFIEVLYDELPKNGIVSAYMVLFDAPVDQTDKAEPPEQANLVFGYNFNWILKKPISDFSTTQLLPDVVMCRKSEEPHLMCIIKSRSSIYGYMLFGVNADPSRVTYEFLAANIAGALRNINLYEALEDSVKQKTDFMVNITHEIRTPLMVIDSYLQKFIKDNGSHNDLLIIENNVNKLKRDMVNILDMEKLEKGIHVYDHSENLDFSWLAAQYIENFRQVAENRKIRIESHIKPGINLMIDQNAAESILQNLLSNAVKYNFEGGCIEVYLSEKKGKIFLRVINSGEEISAEHADQIFQSYYQISRSKKSSQGIGMGLSLVKRIMDGLNGEISLVRSTKKQTEMVCVFYASSEAAGERRSFETNTEKILLRFDTSDSQINDNKETIMVVEDNQALLTILKDTLCVEFNIICAVNGKEALDKLKFRIVPSLIISDVMMDEMDGFAFYENIQRNRKMVGIPFIFLSARAERNERIEALKMGAVDFITKPFEMEELIAKINSILTQDSIKKEQLLVEIREELQSSLLNDISFIPAEKNNKIKSFPSRVREMSAKENEIIKMLVKGMQYKEIASSLQVSINTVKSHIKSIYKKFNVKGKEELIRMYNS